MYSSMNPRKTLVEAFHQGLDGALDMSLIHGCAKIATYSWLQFWGHLMKLMCVFLGKFI